MTYKYNFTAGFGMATGITGIHSEELFNYCGGANSPGCEYNFRAIQYNVTITFMWNAESPPTAITGNYNIGDEAADMYHTPIGSFNNENDSNNVFIIEGTGGAGGGGAVGYAYRIGCNAGTCDNNILNNNYFDVTGAYGPYDIYNNFTFSSVSGNKNLVTGNPCQPSSWNITGGGTGSGTCN